MSSFHVDFEYFRLKRANDDDFIGCNKNCHE